MGNVQLATKNDILYHGVLKTRNFIISIKFGNIDIEVIVYMGMCELGVCINECHEKIVGLLNIFHAICGIALIIRSCQFSALIQKRPLKKLSGFHFDWRRL